MKTAARRQRMMVTRANYIVTGAFTLAPEQKWQFAEYALQHAFEALDKLIHVMRHGESETACITAADKILDRALGKAPPHIDVTALRHTEIVYRSAEQIRHQQNGRRVSVHWFAGVLQSLCSPS